MGIIFKATIHYYEKKFDCILLNIKGAGIPPKCNNIVMNFYVQNGSKCNLEYCHYALFFKIEFVVIIDASEFRLFSIQIRKIKKEIFKRKKKKKKKKKVLCEDGTS